MRVVRRTMGALAVCALLGACAAPGGPPEPVQIEGVVIASTELNPDINGRPSPVLVRIYQLRSQGVFESADFFALYREQNATLGADLLASDELQIKPGESRPYRTEFDPAARYLGVIAAFRDLGNAQWRGSVAVPEDKLLDFFTSNRLRIVLDKLGVQVAVGKP